MVPPCESFSVLFCCSLLLLLEGSSAAVVKMPARPDVCCSTACVLCLFPGSSAGQCWDTTAQSCFLTCMSRAQLIAVVACRMGLCCQLDKIRASLRTVISPVLQAGSTGPIPARCLLSHRSPSRTLPKALTPGVGRVPLPCSLTVQMKSRECSKYTRTDPLPALTLLGYQRDGWMLWAASP